jgi:hypothetical protein
MTMFGQVFYSQKYRVPAAIRAEVMAKKYVATGQKLDSLYYAI